MTAPVIVPFILFGGFLLQNGSVTVYLDWLRYVSWFMYANEALLVNQWHDVSFTNPDCGYLNSLTNMTDYCTEVPPPLVEEVIDLMDAYQRNVVCSGDDILARYKFDSVRNYSIFISRQCYSGKVMFTMRTNY